MLSKFDWNGIGSEQFGIKIERMPSLSRSARKFSTTSVPGYNGNIYQLEDAYEEVIIPYQIFAGNRNKNGVGKFTDIAEWLHSANGYAKLCDTYDPEHYREAVFVDGLDIESTWHTLGRTTINFRCKPQRFLVDQVQEVSSGDVIINPTNHIAKPIITLTGGGRSSLFKMSGRTLFPQDNAGYFQLRGLVPQRYNHVFILKRDWLDTSVPHFLLGNEQFGEIEELTDTDGMIEFTVTGKSYSENWGVGAIIDVQPDTDYTVSAEAYFGGGINVFLADKTGYNAMTKVFNSEVAGDNWVSTSLTFHTDAETGYALIQFYHPAETIPGKSTQQFRNVMLAYGTEAKPFREYRTATMSNFTINDVTLRFLETGFDTAVIDCDRENFALDGADLNSGSMLLDKYGNLSVDYLQLQKGENEISWSGDITAVSIDTRFWEL